jgi:hypothetical protein
VKLSTEAWIHGGAFCLAAAIGAVVVRPLYPLFEAQSESTSEAFGAYLTCVVIIGGVGTGLSLLFVWLRGKF